MHNISIGLLFLIIFISCSKQPLNFENTEPINVQVLKENVPDFSSAGYKKNEEPIPDIPATIKLTPSAKNDRQMIQKAIDDISKLPLVNGFRGCILLEPGEFFVDNTLYIKKSGIVIRGSGQGEKGTIIHATNKAERFLKPEEVIFSRAMQMVSFSLIHVLGENKQISKSTPVSIVKDAKFAQDYITVNNSSKFKVGDSIVIVKTTNSDWIDKIQMSQFGWQTKDYIFQYRRVIKNINQNNIYLDIPLVDNILLNEGGGTVETISLPGRIEHIGLENVRLISTLEGHTPEHHTWTAIRLENVTNSWVRNITALHFSYAAVDLVGRSDFNTIQDCAMIRPQSIVLSPRRYHFYITGGTGNLFQRCFSEAGRHDFATSAKVTGPNVFLDCLSINSSNDIGPHHRWSSGILFDNVSGARLTAHNRGAAGSGHGWVGAQIMYWNSHATKRFTVESPPNAVNWCIGCTGTGISGDGYWASVGRNVFPRSIFIEQLDDRLGKAKTNNIISPEQRTDNNIWDKLANWQGSDNAIIKTLK